MLNTTRIAPRSYPLSGRLGRACLTAGALLFLTGSLAESAPTAGSGLEGVAQVVDGDTVEISGQRVRLEGMDAPESAQTCQTASGEITACGRQATRALFELIRNENIACESVGTDKYGRMLGICFLDGEDINRYMVESGNAWAFIKYSQRYVSEEAKARAAKIGIWQGPAIPAWEFRHSGWQVAEAAAPQGCAIKGNVSKHGKIYPLPWQLWYSNVKIDEARGERWFCSEAEALAAGWRPAHPN